MSDADGAEGADEALLSTEYDPDGRVRRIGLELSSSSGAAASASPPTARGNVATGADGASFAEAVTALAIRAGRRARARASTS